MKALVDVTKAIGYKFAPYTVSLSNNDAILYALSIGFSQDPLNKDHFKFTYENDESFQTFPTIPVVLGHRNLNVITETPGVPQFNLMMLLHGEEHLEIFKPVTPDMKVVVEEKMVDFADKGKGAAAVIETSIKNSANGELLSKFLTTLFIRGIGGFGHKQTVIAKIPEAPKRAADFSREEKTLPNQAFLYRLNSDLNPLHVDPDMAAMGGFDKPILHGLCTYGFTGRAVYEKYAKNDPLLIKKFGGRFTSHVFPGETLIVEMWKDGNLIVFETKTKERGLVALKGYAELRESAKL